MKARFTSLLLLISMILQAGEPMSAPVPAYHVFSYHMNINLFHCCMPPYPRSYAGNLEITVLADSLMNEIRFNADTSSLRIDSVGPISHSFVHSDNILKITFDQPYHKGDTLLIMIWYHHRDVNDNAFFAGNGMVFTNCEPEGARKWFPCHDVPSDKAYFELIAKTPTDVTLASNGFMADSTADGDTLTYRWESVNPLATYLMVIAAANDYTRKTIYWQRLSNPSDSIPAVFYYRPGESPDPVASVILPMTDYYSELFCEYPFVKIGFASMNELFYGGGMENQTLISLCSTCWKESLAAHEFAHMWFGDLVTCATWSDIWLNEGLATWTTVHWQEHKQGYASYKTFLINQYAKQYLANNPGYSISDSSWAKRTPSFDTLFNTYITYEKGACMVHQLRYILGDSIFFAVLKAYVNDTAHRFRSASIGDLMSITRKVSGVDYNWFFNDWVFRPNHPQYQNTYEIRNEGTTSGTLLFEALQVQENPAFFRMILPLKIIFADSTDTLIRVMNTVNRQQFSFTFGKNVARLVFDPDTDILLKTGSTSLGIVEPAGIPATLTLYQNIPNPAGDKTDIPYQLGLPMNVKLEIFDITGRILSVPLSGNKPAGKFTFTLDCSGFHAGTFFYRMTAGKYQATKKMVIMPTNY